MFWVALNSVLGILVAGMIAHKLLNYADMLNPAERIGLGMQGGAAVLTLAVRWDIDNLGTPFTGWSTTLWLVGLLIYMVGRLSRHVRHRRNNKLQAKMTRSELGGGA